MDTSISLIFVIMVTIFSVVIAHPAHFPIPKISEVSVNEVGKRSKRDSEIPKMLVFKGKQLSSTLILSGGSNHVLECEAGGYPAPVIYWMKNGKNIQQELLSSVEEDKSSGLSVMKSKLYLDCVTSSDVGEYTCVAENDNESIKTVVKVEVEADEEDLCLRKKQFEIEPPARINLWTVSLLETEGNEAKLFCRTESLAKSKVIWLNQNENEIQNSDKYEISEDGDLIIRNIEWSDMGTYQCWSRNDREVDKVTSFLYPLKANSEET